MEYFKKAHEILNNPKTAQMPGLEAYIDFISNTLVPDLKDSGNDATAEDFEHLVSLLDHGEHDQDFENFLSETLIPDLRDSGTDATADDFEEGLGYLEQLDTKS